MGENRVIDQDGYLRTFRTEDNNLTSKSENIVNVIACGDVGPVRKLEGMVLQKGPKHVLGDFSPVFRDADIVFANLESVFSLRGSPLDRTPVFRVSPDAFSLISEAGINVVSLANNHMFDFGPDAFVDTVKLLDDHHIAHSGAGLTREDASQPCIVEKKGIKIGFLAYRDKESHWFNHHGVFTAEIMPAIIQEQIRMLRPSVDFLVLSLHSGWEYQFYPSVKDVDLYRSFIDTGADIILGHHPHYPQGVERYKHGLIAYSLGNFIWDQNFTGHTSSSYALEITLDKTRIITARVLPSRMNKDYQLRYVNEQAAIDEIETFSNVLLHPHKLHELWYFNARNKILEFLKFNTLGIFNDTAPYPVKLKKYFFYATSPRLIYTAMSLIRFVISGKAFLYEYRRRIDK